MGSRTAYIAEVESSSPSATSAAARRIASILELGDLILLTGGIGSGKTAFTQALGAGLGIKDTITSPSFVIQEVYESGRLQLSHVDLYRLETRGQVEEVGWEDYLDSGVTVVEWADRYAFFPEPYLTISFELGPRDDDRKLTVTATGGDWRERVGRVMSSGMK